MRRTGGDGHGRQVETHHFPASRRERHRQGRAGPARRGWIWALSRERGGIPPRPGSHEPRVRMGGGRLTGQAETEGTCGERINAALLSPPPRSMISTKMQCVGPILTRPSPAPSPEAWRLALALLHVNFIRRRRIQFSLADAALACSLLFLRQP
jgi:hypothetical protein